MILRPNLLEILIVDMSGVIKAIIVFQRIVFRVSGVYKKEITISCLM